MIKYKGKYRLNSSIDMKTGTPKITASIHDNYLSGKYSTQCYMHSETLLALYLPSGRSSANIILPQLDDLGVRYTLHIEGDKELVYLFPESDIHKVHSVVVFKTKGKNIDPRSKRNIKQ